MTDPTQPVSDEDLSAAIDGEFDADLQARIDASPKAAARLAELQAVAGRLGSSEIPALDDDQVDELISAALDAPVAPAGAGRGSRRESAPWLVAASIVILMAVGLTLIWTGRGDVDDRASSTAADAPTEVAADPADGSLPDPGQSGTDTAEDQVAEETSRTTEPEAAPTTTIPPELGAGSSGTGLAGYLGSFTSGDEIREALAVALVAPTTSSPTPDENADSTPSQASFDRCSDLLKITLTLQSDPIQWAYATVDGDPVLVYEFATTSSTDGSATTLVAVMGRDACQQVVIFER